ncbi:MAG: hypothetical protein NVSMB57_00670 [Actinomycetota bacterium]
MREQTRLRQTSRQRVWRGSYVALAALYCLLSVGGLAAIAIAQSPPTTTVDVTVLSISPYNDPTTPLHIELKIRNKGQLPIDNGRVQLLVFPKVGSRSELRSALNGNPHRSSRTPYATGDDLHETLEPGQETTVTVTRDLVGLSNVFRKGGNGEGVYPLQLRIEGLDRELWTGWAAMVFLSSSPSSKLNVAWVIPVHTPAMADTDGPVGGTGGRQIQSLYTGKRVDRALGPDGSLLTLSKSFPKLSSLSATFAPTPLTLDEVAEISRGYRRHETTRTVDARITDGAPRGAQVVIAQLRQAVAPSNVEIATVPYARADLVTLMHNGLGSDVATQLSFGHQQAAKVLGRGPNSRLLVPADLRLDEGAIGTASALGIRTVVLDEANVQPQQEPFGAIKPVTVEGSGGARLTAVLADTAIRERLETSETADPTLRAQAVLAETASSYFELPAIAAGRGVVLASAVSPDPRTVASLAKGLAVAPWLKMRSISGFIQALPSTAPSQHVTVTTVAAPSTLAALRTARRAINVLSLVIVGAPGATDPLERLLLAAESADWTNNVHGTELARAVRTRAEAIVSAVKAVHGRQITLTSRTGQLPVTIFNGTSYKVHVLVRLASTKVVFPEGESRPVDVADTPKTITIPAKARTAGAFGVSVQLRTPNDEYPIGGDEIIVRSTAVSLVALLAMGGGALVLLAAWIRRGGHKNGRDRKRARKRDRATFADGTVQPA